MSAGSSSQNFRKTIGAIKDSTLVAKAKVNSTEYKELNVSILKATNHVEVLPKEKHVRSELNILPVLYFDESLTNIFGAVSGSRPRADVAYCIHTLTRRLAKTSTWVVALKTLIVIHRALREVDNSFCEELIYYNNNRGHMFNLLHFKDDSSPNAWDYSNWIRTYALYIEECLECFRVLKYDFHRDYSRTKKFGTPALLEQLPALQQLLFRLLACEPVGAARYNFMIQYALSIVAAESVRLYVAITDGVLVLVDKFFEMQRHDAVRALDIYRKSGEQAQKLSEFFEMCRSLDFGRTQKYVKIEQPPASFLAAMEEYVKDTPQPLMLPWRANDEGTLKLIAVPETNLEEDPKQASTEERSADAEENPKTDKSGAEPAPLIPDLLSWDEPSQEASDSGGVTPDILSDPISSTKLSSQQVSWELALVTEQGPDAASVVQKGGVLDRSTLDSLYDVALSKPNTIGAYQATNVSSTNPFEDDNYIAQETISAPNFVGYPNFMQCTQTTQRQAAAFAQQQQNQSFPALAYMQVAGMTQQQPAFVNQQQQQQSSFVAHGVLQKQDDQQFQSLVTHDCMQIAGITPQQPALVDQVQHQQQQEFSIVGHDFMQMAEMPLGQQEVYTEQQQGQPQQKLKVENMSADPPIGNPFDLDLGQLPGPPQTQSSDLSLL